MEVVERKPIPIYEVVCEQCKSKIQYKASEVSLSYITCPVCGVLVWANTILPVKMEDCKDISVAETGDILISEAEYEKMSRAMLLAMYMSDVIDILREIKDGE